MNQHQVKEVFGDDIPSDIPIATIIEELRQHYHIFVLWPSASTYLNAREQYVQLFGEESVYTLQHPDLICEMIGSLVGLNEDRVTQEGLAADLVEVGVAETDLGKIAASVKGFKRKIVV
jgi:hypothetical protein